MIKLNSEEFETFLENYKMLCLRDINNNAFPISSTPFMSIIEDYKFSDKQLKRIADFVFEEDENREIKMNFFFSLISNIDYIVGTNFWTYLLEKMVNDKDRKLISKYVETMFFTKDYTMEKLNKEKELYNISISYLNRLPIGDAESLKNILSTSLRLKDRTIQYKDYNNAFLFNYAIDHLFAFKDSPFSDSDFRLEDNIDEYFEEDT